MMKQPTKHLPKKYDHLHSGNSSLNSESVNSEKFDRSFSHTTESLLNLKLGLPDFDQVHLDKAFQGLSREECLNLLNLKLNKLVEIFMKEEAEVESLETNNSGDSFAAKTESIKKLILQAEQQLQEQTERNEMLALKAQKGYDQSQTVSKELQSKEGAIFELNKNIQHLVTDFITARDRNDKVEEKIRQIKTGIKNKEEEFRGIRPGTVDFENKLNRLWVVEKNLKEEESAQQSLESENDQLKKELKELAPHSVLSPTDKNPRELASLIDLEKYADMKPEDIHREIESLKSQATRQQDVINRLEAKNRDDIDAINIQKSRIEGLREKYVEDMESFYQTKQDRQFAMDQMNRLEEDMTTLLRNFNTLSTLLGKEHGNNESGRNVSGTGARDAGVLSSNHSRFREERSGNGKSGNKAEVGEFQIPAPSTLKVHPFRGETKENVNY